MKAYVGSVQLVSIVLYQPEVQAKIPEQEKSDGILTIAEILDSNSDKKQLTEDQFSDLTALNSKYQNLFATDPGRTNLVVHDIEVTDQFKIQCKAYRFPTRQEKLLKESVDQMLELRIIERCASNFVSPMIFGGDPW